MVEKFSGYKSHITNKLYLSEEAAIRDETMAGILATMPELVMVQDRVLGNLHNLTIAMGPMLDYIRRVPSGPAEVEHTTILPSTAGRWAACPGKAEVVVQVDPEDA